MSQNEKNKQKYNTGGTFLKYNRNITERCNIATHRIQRHDSSLSLIGASTSIHISVI
jgi:hypothetical protein